MKTTAYSTALTPRELEICAKVTEGLSHSEIGDDLGISRETVTRHLSNICDKLGLDNKVMVAVWYVRKYELQGGLA